MSRFRKITLPFVILLFLPWFGYSESESTNLETRAGWVKPEANPVLGGALGTCFDICVLKDEGKLFRMWFSWRPKKSVALVESADGVHWGEPRIALGPDPKSDWQADINRPVVVYGSSAKSRPVRSYTTATGTSCSTSVSTT